jgi:hypothetical protein
MVPVLQASKGKQIPAVREAHTRAAWAAQQFGVPHGIRVILCCGYATPVLDDHCNPWLLEIRYSIFILRGETFS